MPLFDGESSNTSCLPLNFGGAQRGEEIVMATLGRHWLRRSGMSLRDESRVDGGRAMGAVSSSLLFPLSSRRNFTWTLASPRTADASRNFSPCGNFTRLVGSPPR